MTEVEFKSEITNWVLKKSKVPNAQVTDETKLLEQKIISSLQIMDLVLFIEKLTGKKTELAALKPTSFQSVNSISSAFFKP